MKNPLVLIFALSLAPLLSAHGQSIGAIKATTRVLPDGSTLTTVTNPDTRTRDETIADTKGKVLRKTTYALDDQNFATGATHFDARGAVRYKEVYKFDYAGRVLESALFSREDRPLGRRVFVYDQKNPNQPRIEDYDASGNRVTASPGPAVRTGRPEVRRAVPAR